MSDQFSRLANHFSNYWHDKGTDMPKMNFNIKAIEKEAEEKAKNDLPPIPEKSEDKHKVNNKPKEFSISGVINDGNDIVEKAIENKVKTLIGRLADDKIRTAISDDLALFEKSMAGKIEEIVNRLKPKVLAELKSVAPDIGKSSLKKSPSNFTDVVMDEEESDGIPFDKDATIEVFPEIYVKANKNDTGNVYIKKNGFLHKMAYVIDLPKVNSKKEYIKELQSNIENIIK